MILPPNPQNSSIAQGLNTGLSGLLEGLAKGKAQKMQTKNTFEALKGLMGPEQALAIAGLPPQAQAVAFKGLVTKPAAEKRAEQQLNKTGRLERAKSVKSAESLLPTVRRAKELLSGLKATGPLAGRLIPGSEEASEFDSIVSQLVLDQEALKGLGSRGTNLGLKLRQESKPSRTMFKKAAENRLDDIEKSVMNIVKDFDIENQILEANGGEEPANLDHYINNVKKLAENIEADPDAEELPEGSQVDQKGYLFEKRDGEWTFIGKSK